ncbi:MAG TPA: lytic polysaccharide monooxygenase auxiliary activity family 9 protein [Fibrobacteria bacterium]|nr:lytic polysaccharide monooxygenase auxiliary activity family 9 protein [Fibrobacteria bacterium]
MAFTGYRSLLVVLFTGAPLLADGLIESPPARNWYCGFTTKPDHIVTHTAQYPACSTAFAGGPPNSGYNFMTVVTHSWGRAKTQPLPKHVCSFDSETWKGVVTAWDVPMDWPTTEITSGPMKITWNGSWGAHYDDTRDFSYWITKPDFVFSPNRELTWDDFEAEPFCVELYDDKNPTANPNLKVDKSTIRFTATCTVPARTGRHVIYGEWGRTEATLQRFHGCSDVTFGGAGTAVRESGLKKARAGTEPGQRVDALGRPAAKEIKGLGRRP